MTFDNSSIDLLDKVCDLHSSPRERTMQAHIYDLHSRLKRLRSENKTLNKFLESNRSKLVPDYKTGLYWE